MEKLCFSRDFFLAVLWIGLALVLLLIYSFFLPYKLYNCTVQVQIGEII